MKPASHILVTLLLASQCLHWNGFFHSQQIQKAEKVHVVSTSETTFIIDIRAKKKKKEIKPKDQIRPNVK